MKLNEYQLKAMTTCTRSSNNATYMLLNLAGELGELCSKIAKAVRKEQVVIRDNHLSPVALFDLDCLEEYAQLDEQLCYEAGDILWQLSGLCSVMKWDLEKVAQMNLAKLAQRKKNGTIVGSGDGVTREERNG